MNSSLNYASNHKGDFLKELQNILAIPSISTLPEHKPDIDRMAEWLRVHLLEIGMDQAEIYQTDGHPIVYAEWLRAPDQTTLLIYGHYDVQPPDPLDQWHTPPFQPTIKDGYIYARGSADDKAQFFTHFKAIESIFKTTHQLPINIKILLEAEEELGSENLENFIKNNKNLLKADTAAISDSHMIGINQPLLETALRGLVYFEINLQTANQDLHSGTYGGGVANAATVLANILSQLKDNHNKILIPEFYDQVLPLPAAEKTKLHASTSKFKTTANAYHYVHEPKFPPHLMPKLRPSLDINGISSGFTGSGQKTIIPSRAMAKVSCRLVPDQDPKQITRNFIKYIKSLAPTGVKITIRKLSQCTPVVVPYDGPYMKAAAKTLKTTFGTSPKYSREGGSIPVVEIFQRLLKINSVLMGYGLPDDNLHAPNERFYLPHFHKGIANNIRYYFELAKA